MGGGERGLVEQARVASTKREESSKRRVFLRAIIISVASTPTNPDDGTVTHTRVTCYTAAVIPKVERPGIRSSTISSPSSSSLLGFIDDIRKCHRGCHRLRCSWSPFRHEPRQPPPRGAIFRRWRRQVLLLSLGVFWRRAP